MKVFVKFDNLPENREDLLPCKLYHGSRIYEDLIFPDPMTVLCVEAKSDEIPTDSLMDCEPHTYVLLQVLFRLASQLHNKFEPYALVSSLLGPARGDVECGRVFWLVFPTLLKRWLKLTVRDILVVNYGYAEWHKTLSPYMRYEELMDSPLDSEDEDDDDDEESSGDNSSGDGSSGDGSSDNDSSEDDSSEDDSSEDDDEDEGRPARGKGRKRKRRGDGTGSFKYAFRTFIPKHGMGVVNKFKGRNKLGSPLPSFKTLEDFDLAIEMYFRFEIPGMPAGKPLRPTVRRKDDEQAWDVRLDLLSPTALFGSRRRKDYREQLTQELYDKGAVEAVGGKRERIMELDELMKVDRQALLDVTARSLEQIDPKAIIREPDGRRISFRHMVAWKMKPYMFEPDYFLRRTFPS